MYNENTISFFVIMYMFQKPDIICIDLKRLFASNLGEISPFPDGPCMPNILTVNV